MNRNEEKKKLGVIDIFIILVLAVCAVSIGLRFFADRRSISDEKIQLENYNITFRIYGIRDSSAKNFIRKGEKFFFDDPGTIFGTVSDGNITITPAEKLYEGLDGSIVAAKNNGTGDLYKVDVEAEFAAQGLIDSNGRLLINGNKYVGINQVIPIHSKYYGVSVLITGIEKAQ